MLLCPGVCKVQYIPGCCRSPACCQCDHDTMLQTVVGGLAQWGEASVHNLHTERAWKRSPALSILPLFVACAVSQPWCHVDDVIASHFQELWAATQVSVVGQVSLGSAAININIWVPGLSLMYDATALQNVTQSGLVNTWVGVCLGIIWLLPSALWRNRVRRCNC